MNLLFKFHKDWDILKIQIVAGVFIFLAIKRTIKVRFPKMHVNWIIKTVTVDHEFFFFFKETNALTFRTLKYDILKDKSTKLVTIMHTKIKTTKTNVAFHLYMVRNCIEVQFTWHGTLISKNVRQSLEVTKQSIYSFPIISAPRQHQLIIGRVQTSMKAEVMAVMEHSAVC